MRRLNLLLTVFFLVACTQKTEPDPKASPSVPPAPSLAPDPQAAAAPPAQQAKGGAPRAPASPLPSASLLAGRAYRTGRAQAGTAVVALCSERRITYVADGTERRGTFEFDGRVLTAQFGAERAEFVLSEDLERMTAPGDAYLKYAGPAPCDERQPAP